MNFALLVNVAPSITRESILWVGFMNKKIFTQLEQALLKESPIPLVPVKLQMKRK